MSKAVLAFVEFVAGVLAGGGCTYLCFVVPLRRKQKR